MREDTDWTMEYNLADTSDNYSGNDNGAGEACDMFIGKTLRRADYADGIKAEFYGLDSTHYGYLADGESARAEFVNNKAEFKKYEKLCADKTKMNKCVKESVAKIKKQDRRVYWD